MSLAIFVLTFLCGYLIGHMRASVVAQRTTTAAPGPNADTTRGAPWE